MTANPRMRAMPRQSLPGLPKGALSPEDQLEALQRVQDRAEQRVQLGLQLFKAAQAHTLGYRDLLEDLKSEGEKLRDEVAQDVTRSLHAMDQWVAQRDETFSEALLTLEQRINDLESRLAGDQARLSVMLKQSEKLLTQAQAMLDEPAPPVMETTASAEPEVLAEAEEDAVSVSPEATAQARYEQMMASIRQRQSQTDGSSAL